MKRTLLTLEDGANVFPDGDTPTAVKLAQSQFHVEQRHATKDSHQQVRQEKGTCEAQGFKQEVQLDLHGSSALV